jgi:hypothetical protein
MYGDARACRTALAVLTSCTLRSHNTLGVLHDNRSGLRLYGRAPKGKRTTGEQEFGRGRKVSVLPFAHAVHGVVDYLICDGAVDAEVRTRYHGAYDGSRVERRASACCVRPVRAQCCVLRRGDAVTAFQKRLVFKS